MSKTSFKMPVIYMMSGYITIEGETLEEAVNDAKNNINELPLPDNPDYVEDSYEIDDDIDSIRAMNN